MKCKKRQCKRIIDFYDKDGDHKLIYREFLAMVLPLDDSGSRQSAAEKDVYFVNDRKVLPYVVEDLLVQLITKEFEFNELLERNKLALLNTRDYKVQAAFKAIDTSHSRSLSFSSIEGYFKRLNYKIKAEDVVAIMRRLDQDLDCKISFKEFVKAFTLTNPKVKLRPSYTTPTRAFTNSQLLSTEHTTPHIRQTILTNTRSTFKSVKKLKTCYSTFKRTSIRKKLFTETKSIASPKKLSNEELVFTIMERQAEMERRIELIKRDLVLFSNVTPKSIWTIFDPTEKGYITYKELLGTITALGISAESVDVLFNRFDSGRKNVWKFSIMKEVMMPVGKEYIEIVQLRKEDTIINKEALPVLRELLMTHIGNEVMNKRFSVNKRTLKKAFEQCAISNNNYFTLKDVLYNIKELAAKSY